MTTGKSEIFLWNKKWEKLLEKRDLLSKDTPDDKRYYTEFTNMIINNNILGNSACELGCGTGRHLTYLNGYFKRLCFIDGSKKALKVAKSMAKSNGIHNASFIQKNIFDTKDFRERFDLVLNSGVIEHYPKKDIKRIIKIMIKLTKRSGKVLVAWPNLRSLSSIYLNYSGSPITTEKYYCPEEIYYLMQLEGLKNIKQLTFPIAWPPINNELFYSKTKPLEHFLSKHGQSFLFVLVGER